MMNVYTRDIKIYLEDEVIGSCYDYILEDESEIMNNEISGNSFAGLWDVLKDFSWIYLFCARREKGLFSNKRRIEPWKDGDFKTWKEDGSTREWKVVCKEEKCSCKLEQFKNFNVEKVIQYFKERGINSINL